MLRKFLASLATVALAIGIVATAAVPAQAGNTSNTNDPANWVAVAGETCVKWDSPGTTSLSTADLVSHFGLAGKTITKVVIKAGSSGSSVTYENTAYYADAAYKLTVADTWWIQANLATTSFVHVDGPAGASGKNISHVIVCYTTPAPTAVSGAVNHGDQVCDDEELLSGWIAPIAKTGVKYELYASNKTTPVAVPFTSEVAVSPGTYWVKVISTDSTLYTVSEANTWIEVVVGAFTGGCGTVEPTPVSGAVNADDQTCDTEEYSYVSGWLAPVATDGVRYELYAADKTTLLDGTFDAKTDLAPGTYWVKVVSTDPALYSVSEANTWIQKTVGEYDGDCEAVEPTPVSGDVNSDDETCTVEYDLENGWIEPVATNGVRYELYAGDKTTLLDGTFDAKAELAPGTYWVKVISTDPALYTVSEANTWIEVTVGEYDGDCVRYVDAIGDPFDFQGCVNFGSELEPQNEWVATLTIDTADTEPTGSVQYRVYVWDGASWVDQGIWPEGVYTAGPGGDFPYTQVKVVAEAVSPFAIKDGTKTEWIFDFSDPFDCDQETLGPIVPEVSFTNPTCSADGSYTLTSPGPHDGLPAKTVTWYVNDVETEPGTYSVTAPSSVTIRVVANTGYTFETDEGFTTEIVYPTKSFVAPTVCGDLTTLALTGDNVSGLLGVTALLGLIGTMLIRAGRRMGRDAARG
jgi:flagellar hook assembly protein FlgD